MAAEHMFKYTQKKPPPPSSSLSDEELLRMGPHELLKRLRKAEGDSVKAMLDHGAVMKDVSSRMQMHLLEIRGLKEVNQRLQDDNQELRDLCCFLDDHRQKGRKLAREWQRFGRYTASVMRQEVSAYQAKLRELEGKQQELIKDNLELKELCLYLDEERNISRSSLCAQCGSLLNHGLRDEGDGSSSSTNNDELNLPIHPPPPTRSSSRERLLEESFQRQRGILTEQILQYIKSLEQRIHQLEEEKRSLQKNGRMPSDSKKMERQIYTSPFGRDIRIGINREDHNPLRESSDGFVGSNKPEAVVHAMKVLEVHEQLEKPILSDFDDIGQGEKALVREMCNVVWRKLEDGPSISQR